MNEEQKEEPHDCEFLVKFREDTTTIIKKYIDLHCDAKIEYLELKQYEKELQETFNEEKQNA